MPSNHLILCHPLLLPSIFPSIRVFPSESHQVAKVLEFQLQHQSYQWTPRADLLQDGLVGSPCSPRDSQESSPTPQLKSINSSALSFLYSPHTTTGKTIALTRWTFVDKVMSLLFNMLSGLVINLKVLGISKFSDLGVAAAAAAKSLQSWLTLCDPIDGSPPGSSVPGILHWSGLPFPSPMHESEKWKSSHSVMSDTQRPHGLQPSRLFCPWDFPGKSTGVGCHCLLRIMSYCFDPLEEIHPMI